MYRSYRVYFQGVRNPKIYWTQYSSLSYAKRKAFEKCVLSVHSNEKTFFCIESCVNGECFKTQYFIFFDNCVYPVSKETYFNERGAIAD